MTCEICGQEMRPPSTDGHCKEQSPVNPSACLGCWVASVEVEKFLLRACDRTVMGNWTAGWLKEIIKDPRRYLAGKRTEGEHVNN
jgi:hypothetical protein